MTSRRRFLAALGTGMVGIAGCLSGPGPREAADPWLERSVTEDETDNGTPVEHVTGRVKLTRGEFTTYEFGHPEEVMFIDFRGDTVLSLPFDVATVRRSELSAFANGEKAEFFSTASSFDTTGTRFHSRLQAGEYAIVLDNSRMWGSRPLDEVEIRFELSIEY